MYEFRNTRPDLTQNYLLINRSVDPSPAGKTPVKHRWWLSESCAIRSLSVNVEDRRCIFPLQARVSSIAELRCRDCRHHMAFIPGGGR